MPLVHSYFEGSSNAHGLRALFSGAFALSLQGYMLYSVTQLIKVNKNQLSNWIDLVDEDGMQALGDDDQASSLAVARFPNDDISLGTASTWAPPLSKNKIQRPTLKKRTTPQLTPLQKKKQTQIF